MLSVFIVKWLFLGGAPFRAIVHHLRYRLAVVVCISECVYYNMHLISSVLMISGALVDSLSVLLYSYGCVSLS